MRHLFFDTSALVKLYSVEEGSERVRNMVRSALAHPPAAVIHMCDLAAPEAASGLAQAARAPDAARRGLSRVALRQALDRLAKDLAPPSRFSILHASHFIDDAVGLVRKHRIRGADAVHLAAACALVVSPRLTSEFVWVCSDRALNAAAAAEGLAVYDPAV